MLVVYLAIGFVGAVAFGLATFLMTAFTTTLRDYLTVRRVMRRVFVDTARHVLWHLTPIAIFMPPWATAQGGVFI